MTSIQWTDKTDNPLKRADGGNYCEKISPGCANCYASGLNSKGTRFGGNGQAYGGERPADRPEMTLNCDMLASWARMRKPKRHFVGSMTDIFGEWVSDDMIFDLFDAMEAAPLQTFQVLTKRPERLSVLEKLTTWNGLTTLPQNIWLGASAEDQKRLDERLIYLIRSLAQIKFLSLEPLLGPIEFPDLDSEVALMLSGSNPRQILAPMDYIDWVIIGGESGPNARPLELDWVRDILQQCEAADIPAFLKQLGTVWAKEAGAKDRKGGNPAEWPEWARVRQFPTATVRPGRR